MKFIGDFLVVGLCTLGLYLANDKRQIPQHVSQSMMSMVVYSWISSSVHLCTLFQEMAQIFCTGLIYFYVKML